VSYTVAAALGLAGALLLDLVVLRTRLVVRREWWLLYPIVLACQLVANGILTGRRIVRYSPDAVIGWRIVYAPVEDLAFGFALVLATLSVWVALGRLGTGGRDGTPVSPPTVSRASPGPPGSPLPPGSPTSPAASASGDPPARPTRAPR
jgi:lycopene cyclase domain-containing protein